MRIYQQDDGATVFSLAKQFGITRQTVGQHLRARGVDTTRLVLQPEDVALAIELYQAGWAYAQIAEKFGMSQTGLRDRLHQAGLPKAEPFGRRGRNLGRA
ncbi:hypothetical protein [Amycolatopsis sp.]|uniref:hypothetical protein n=1 Tax=Amycolatopsis sp. TaxID=37632 RepID=UPI002CE229E7|nr:hypothetical protein [Amycolatopsis sp.]HVV12480.1 hypothetical protein [Amycolatopsis sp.]